MTVEKEFLGCELKVINIGLELFAATLERHGVPVVHLDWKPPAGGDPRLVQLLRRLNAGRRPRNQNVTDG